MRRRHPSNSKYWDTLLVACARDIQIISFLLLFPLWSWRIRIAGFGSSLRCRTRQINMEINVVIIFGKQMTYLSCVPCVTKSSS